MVTIETKDNFYVTGIIKAFKTVYERGRKDVRIILSRAVRTDEPITNRTRYKILSEAELTPDVYLRLFRDIRTFRLL